MSDPQEIIAKSLKTVDEHGSYESDANAILSALHAAGYAVVPTDSDTIERMAIAMSEAQGYKDWEYRGYFSEETREEYRQGVRNALLAGGQP